MTKHERKGEEIGDDRLQKKDVGEGMRQDQGEVQERIGLKELSPATLTTALRFEIPGFINHFT